MTFDPGGELCRHPARVLHRARPTTLNRQGNDVGTQYRSVIFTHSPAQEATARVVKSRDRPDDLWGAGGDGNRPASAFYIAETYHQEYFARNPTSPIACSWSRPR